MEYLQHLKSAIRQPRVLKPYQPVLLLSHMRANSSLIGHILGSSEEVAGYYEMHIGYYSWKSFIRQKLLYAKDHAFEASNRYVFDKVLHNDHYVSAELINSSNCKTIFCLRSPESTIPSIVTQYKKRSPDHQYCTCQGATNYYIGRLAKLKSLAAEIDDFFYFDADDIRTDTDEMLEKLTRFLALETPLTPTFKTQNYTGKGNTGDHSGHLNSAQVKKFTTDYSNFEFEHDCLERAEKAYIETKQFCMEQMNRSS